MKHPGAQLRLVHAESGTGGEAVDFDALFLRYAPYSAAVACRIMGNTDDVDDIVQDVFIDVHKGLPKLKSIANIRGWVATITVRICTRRLRSRKLQRILLSAWTTPEELDEYQIPQKGLSPDEQLWLKQIYGVLSGMAVPLRIAWTLRYLQGERLEEVATLCGCSLATAKRRILKAHQMIRKVVDDE